MAPPWDAIYTTDAERDQTFVEAVQVHRRATEWYRSLGYELIELPRVPVEERCAFVLAIVGHARDIERGLTALTRPSRY